MLSVGKTVIVSIYISTLYSLPFVKVLPFLVVIDFVQITLSIVL